MFTRRFLPWWKKCLAGVLTYITVAGLVTFSQFILEESIQMAMYGTWQAKSNPPILLKGVRLVNKLNRWLDLVTRYGSWIQPLALLSYRGFIQATQYWVEANLSFILANHPSAFAPGDTLTIVFTPDQITSMEDHWVMKNNQILVRTKTPGKPGEPRHMKVLVLSHSPTELQEVE